LTAEWRAKCLGDDQGVHAASPIVQRTLARILQSPISRPELIERLFEYCAEGLRIGPDDAPADSDAVLQHQVAGPVGRARALAALCRAAKIPARLVTGFEIKSDLDARPHVWVQVMTNGHWESYDPVNGFARQLPHNFVPVLRYGAEIVRVDPVGAIQARYSISPLAPSCLLSAAGRHPFSILDLTRLPLEVHEVLSLILLIPFGALVTSLMRTMVGIPTFGTFTPTLLALSFVYADWRTGLIVLVCVVALGLGSRAVLDRLRLLMVPRVSVILTLVVLGMILGVSVLDRFGFTPGTQAVLLPIVILTMLIERFFLTAEEEGVRFASHLLLGTLVVALACYLVLAWKSVGQMVLVYPEVHLVTVAALVMIGRYNGYRLTELWRFRDLARPDFRRSPW
jgi:hypothetical protein